MPLKYQANILFFLLCQLFFQTVFAQNDVSDNIKKLSHTVDTVKGDSAKCKYTLSMVRAYIGYDLKKADSMLEISKKYYNKKGCDYCELLSMEYKAQIYWLNSDFHQSLQKLIKMQQIAKEKGIIFIYVTCNLNIGSIYFEMGNKEEAKKYFENGIKMASDNINKYPRLKHNIITGLLNLSQIDTGVTLKLEYLNKARKIMDTIKVASKDLMLTLEAYNRELASIYIKTGQYSKSLYHGRLALYYSKLNEDYSLAAFNKVYIARAQQGLGNLDSSKIYLDQAYPVLRDQNIQARLKNYYEVLSRYYALKKDYRGAYKSQIEFQKLSDEITNEDIRNQTSLLNITYQTAKKEEENTRLKSENLTQELQIERTSAERNLFVAGGAGVFILALFLFYSFRQQKQTAKLLQSKNATISQQNNVLYEQKKEITDSIEYALKLQRNLLPNFFSQLITPENSFLIYKPKNIVSGDFYYVFSHQNYTLYLVGDCTGHGVPGAILSVIALEKCKELCEQKLSPANFLTQINTHFVGLLGQKTNEEAVNDGMEISCLVHTNNKWLYAGANRPLFIVEGNELNEVRGDKMGISANNNAVISFTEIALELKRNSRVFLFSDGVADQFGGQNDKKLTTKKLKHWLCETSVLAPAQQKNQLEERLSKWQQNFQQTDDITLIGINIL